MLTRSGKVDLLKAITHADTEDQEAGKPSRLYDFGLPLLLDDRGRPALCSPVTIISLRRMPLPE